MKRERRYVVLGAGGVGCALGGMLQVAGADVVYVARGAQLDALAQDGLTIALPQRTFHLRVEAVRSPRDVRFEDRDVVLFCTKTQDSEAALSDLAACAPRDLPLVCTQNGVATERLAVRAFSRVIGLVFFSPVRFTSPGRISIHGAPVFGGLDLGVHPTGTGDLVDAITRDLAEAGFDARAEPRIQRWKYGKLLTNLGNIVQALAGELHAESPIHAAMSAEATACYRAAGIEFATAEDIYARYAAVGPADVDGAARGGGSTWQSLARATGTIETEYLNGEIVRLGEKHGVPTPVNHAMTLLARRAAEERWPPGHLTMAEIEAAAGAT